MRDFSICGDWRRALALDLVVLILMIWLGPFGTYNDLGLANRSLYWLMVLGGCGTLGQFGVSTSLAAEPLRSWPRFARIALGTTLAGLPGTLIVLAAENAIRERPASWERFWWIWLCVAGIGVSVSYLHLYVFARRPDRTATANDAGTGTGNSPIFLKRLPPALGSDLISLSMQDHYVEAVTARGSQLVLMRFADALAELDGEPGLQVHRSHWVARSAVRGLKRRGHKVMVELADGRKLPVSRPHRSAVRDILKGPNAARVELSY